MPHIPLLQETGKFLYSGYGMYSAFIFVGDEGFMQRTENLILNHELLIHGDIYELPTLEKYILAPEERLFAGLINYFRGEILLEKTANDIDYIVTVKEEITEETDVASNLDREYITVSYNEDKLLELSKQRLQEFWGTKVEKTTMLASFYESSDYADSYDIGKTKQESEINGDSPEEVDGLIDEVYSEKENDERGPGNKMTYDKRIKSYSKVNKFY